MKRAQEGGLGELLPVPRRQVEFRLSEDLLMLGLDARRLRSPASLCAPSRFEGDRLAPPERLQVDTEGRVCVETKWAENGTLVAVAATAVSSAVSTASS
jgi:hypothetical protein